jgi:nicotinamidase-related amidase
LSDANRRDLISRGEAPEERTHIEGSWGWEIIDALKPQPQDLVLRKYRPDAFYGTILDSILRWNGIKTVVTTGVGVAVGGVPTVRLLLVGYFEGIDAERGIDWRAADSLAIRQFLHLALDEAAPDYSTISRTRG